MEDRLKFSSRILDGPSFFVCLHYVIALIEGIKKKKIKT